MAHGQRSKVVHVVSGAALLGGLLAALLSGCGSFQCTELQTSGKCTACSSASKCTTCTEGYDLFGSSDAAQCKIACTSEQKLNDCTACEDGKTCIQCSEGYLPHEGNCQFQCNADQLAQGCTNCEHETKCLDCKAGFEVFEGNCIEACTAEQGAKQCKRCSSTSKCETCQEGYATKNVTNGEIICVADCIVAGKDDLAPDLNLEPQIRNGFEYPSMCVDEEDAHFFAIGDWGGFEIGHNGKDDARTNNGDTVSPNKNAKYGAAGDITGNRYTWDPAIDGQAGRLVANAMNELAKTKKPRFVLNVGDSFYWGGLQEVGCGGDPKKAWDNWRWQKSFRDVHNIPHPTHPEVQVPWFSVLGNHDYGGIHIDSGWDHQIYQTYKPGVNWRMPGQYWSQEIKFRHFSMEVYMLDGNYVDAYPIGVLPNNNICQLKRSPSNGVCDVPGIHAPLKHGPDCFKWFQRVWKDTMVWLEKKLKSSKAHYTMITTHYIANCHNPEMANMMRQYGVDLCVVGHSHWNVIGQDAVNPVTGTIDPSLCSAEQPCAGEPLAIITGGGGGINGEAKANKDNGIYGFIDFHVDRTQFKARIVNYAGNQAGPEWVMKRRPKSSRNETTDVAVQNTKDVIV